MGDTIKEHYLALHQVIALSLLIFAAGAAFVSSSIGAVLAPVAIALVALYGLDVLRSMMALAGYKAWLEEKFAVETGLLILLWDSGISTNINTRSWGKRAVFWFYGLVVLIGAAISTLAAIHYQGAFSGYVRIATVTFWPVYLVAAMVSTLEALRARDASYRRATQLHNASVVSSADDTPEEIVVRPVIEPDRG